MNECIKEVEVYPLRISRPIPYLGPLGKEMAVSRTGNFIRPGNATVYNTYDQSLLVKVVTESGVIGWGECFSVIAPQVTATIFRELLIPLVIGRDPCQVAVIYDDLYNAMRVRGFFGGFYLDALAGLDIALWDVYGKLVGLPVAKLLGGYRRNKIPAYVSGLPRATLSERVELAREWVPKGFDAVKFAAVVSEQGELAEIKALRQGLGPDVKIMCDFHWRYTDQEAIKLISAMEAYDLFFAEAPCNSENMPGQASVSQKVHTPVAIGEELRTTYEFRPRFENRCMSIVQPEMGHTGLTAFWQIGQMAKTFHCRVMPHATIGIGIFLAASLQASAALENASYHEYQHSIFDKNLHYLKTTMRCEAGFYTLPEGPGLGVEPAESVFNFVINQ